MRCASRPSAFCFCSAGGRLEELTWKRAGLPLAVGIAPVLPWAAARYLRDGWTFLTSGVFVGHVEPDDVWQPGDPLMYLKVFLEDACLHDRGCPLCVAAPMAGIRLSGRRLTPSTKRQLLQNCLLWLVVAGAVLLFNFKNSGMCSQVIQRLLCCARVLRFSPRSYRDGPDASGVVLTALVAGLCVAEPYASRPLPRLSIPIIIRWL